MNKWAELIFLANCVSVDTVCRTINLNYSLVYSRQNGMRSVVRLIMEKVVKFTITLSQHPCSLIVCLLNVIFWDFRGPELPSVHEIKLPYIRMSQTQYLYAWLKNILSLL